MVTQWLSESRHEESVHHSEVPGTSSTPDSQRSTLLRRLHDRLRTEPTKKAEKLMENKLAKQSNRRIEIGWLHYESAERCFKQVRPVKGGGTRHLTTPIDATIQSLLELAIDIFSPTVCHSMASWAILNLPWLILTAVHCQWPIQWKPFTAPKKSKCYGCICQPRDVTLTKTMTNSWKKPAMSITAMIHFLTFPSAVQHRKRASGVCQPTISQHQRLLHRPYVYSFALIAI